MLQFMLKGSRTRRELKLSLTTWAWAGASFWGGDHVTTMTTDHVLLKSPPHPWPGHIMWQFLEMSGCVSNPVQLPFVFRSSSILSTLAFIYRSTHPMMASDIRWFPKPVMRRNFSSILWKVFKIHIEMFYLNST